MKAYESRTPRARFSTEPRPQRGASSQSPTECPTILAWLGLVCLDDSPIQPTKSSSFHSQQYFPHPQPKATVSLRLAIRLVAAHPLFCLSQVIRFACHCTFALRPTEKYFVLTILSVINLHLINICRAFVSGSNT